MHRSNDPISRLLKSISKRRAIKRYLTVLPYQLSHDYGHAGPYTPEQVESAIGRHKKLSPEYAAYALAIFCDAASLAELPKKDGWPCDLNDLRLEVGSGYLGGSNFTLQDISRYSSHHNSHSGSGGHHAHGAGHHDGGGGDGGHH